MTDDETDSEELDDMFGVTAATMTRRKRLFQKFNNRDRITNNSTTATIIMQWISRRNWAPTTKLSHFATLTKTLSLNKISIQGDIQGCIRQLKISALASDIQRVPPLTTTMLNTTLQKLNNNTQMEIRVLIELSWTFAARLTSITALTRNVINIQPHDTIMSKIRVTFRTGKTITATGVYTITALLPNSSANWIMQQPMKIFNKHIEHYYKKIRAAISPFKVRSIRRGALQHLARQRISPEKLLLISRHKTMESLYKYLDDGIEAIWEQEEVFNMTKLLWTDSAKTTHRSQA